MVCKQFGGLRNSRRVRKYKGGASAAPLSYLDSSYKEPSATAGINRLISEPLLARPSLNHTGGKRSKKGGFYPSVMGPFVSNASRLVPAAAVQGYRMVRNYNKTKKNRK
jgi:hypothetical protein